MCLTKASSGRMTAALHFIERAAELGVEFLDPMPQRIHSLAKAPNYPGAAGRARRATTEDAELLTAWMISSNPLGPDWRLFCRAGKAWF